MFAQQHIPSLNMERNDDFDYWSLMLYTLEEFGYLSYNDWKFSMEDALGNLMPVLKHYGMDPAIYDDISDKDSIMEPEVCPMIAARLPNTYLLASIDTGADAYAITVVPIETAEKIVAIANAMVKPPHNTGIQLVAAT